MSQPSRHAGGSEHLGRPAAQLWRTAGFVGLGALAVRLAFGLTTGRLWHPEVWEYEQIAQHLLNGEGFIYGHMHTVYRSYCEPLYPWLVAAVYALSHSQQAAMAVIQMVLSAMTAALIVPCAWWLSLKRGVALIAGSVVAVHPGLIVYTTKLHPLVLDALLLTVVVWSALWYAEHPSAGRTAAIGAAIGLCLLTRPTVGALLPLVVWWIWRSQAGGARVRAGRVLLLLLLVAAVASPWVVRNFVVHGRFMLTRSNTPYVFWLGNNPHATGAAMDAQGRDLLELGPPEFRSRILESRDEMAQNRLFAEAAWAYVRERPLAFVQRTWQKWMAFWWFSPQAGQLYPQGWMTAYRWWWGVTGTLALWGVWSAMRLRDPSQRVRWWLLLGALVLIGMVQSFFYVEGRHRLAIEPLVSCFVALGGSQLWPAYRRKA